jgi:hypothetical protein
MKRPTNVPQSNPLKKNQASWWTGWTKPLREIIHTLEADVAGLMLRIARRVVAVIAVAPLLAVKSKPDSASNPPSDITAAQVNSIVDNAAAPVLCSSTRKGKQPVRIYGTVSVLAWSLS